MTYQAVEISAYQGEPIELYRFSLGVDRWLYTSTQQALVYLGETYTPATITRSAIEQGQEIKRSPIDVRMARDNPVAAQFVAAAPEAVMSLSIFRKHVTDPEVILIYKGRVISPRWSGSEVTFRVESIATSLAREGLRARHNLHCRHPLYSVGCGVSKESFRVDGAVAGVSGLTVTVGAASSQPDGWFVPGLLIADSGARMIVGHAGTVITLTAPIVGLGLGEAVRLYAGCDHLYTTCNGKFGNLTRFGGFPFAPKKNPFAGDAIA